MGGTVKRRTRDQGTWDQRVEETTNSQRAKGNCEYRAHQPTMAQCTAPAVETVADAGYCQEHAEAKRRMIASREESLANMARLEAIRTDTLERLDRVKLAAGLTDTAVHFDLSTSEPDGRVVVRLDDLERLTAERAIVDEDGVLIVPSNQAIGAAIERAAAATKAPWSVVGASLVASFGENGATVAAVSEPRATDTVQYTPLQLGSPDFNEGAANAEFIAHARTEVPLFGVLIIKLRAAIVELIESGAVEDWSSRVDLHRYSRAIKAAEALSGNKEP
jgi:hypothetical protein